MSTTQQTAFRANLNNLMAGRDWKPINLAAALSDLGYDVTDWTVKRWCNGDSEPRTTEMIVGIARALDTTPNVLLGVNGADHAGDHVADVNDVGHARTVAAAKS